ncbi:hypothetical protein IVB46_11675 [Bradyrhizobium sp. 61]|uniref:hypothetical protein n=1 Tax=Bradyrhizobium sp. 61 TaxID=2782679 RepID=UPI001FF79FB2|nr:hypothetical protein [Bradyrhizobium sp. 61]MCK1275889.1 hypothetical protein [Bradyrhizobium sp. 61]
MTEPRDQSSAGSGDAAMRLLAAEDERQSKLHEILETIREQIRLEVAPEHRPEGLFKNIQDAVYAMRGRTRLMDDAAITHAIQSRIADGRSDSPSPAIASPVAPSRDEERGRTFTPAQAAEVPPITDLIYLKQQSERLNVVDQHALAEFIAPNLGMMLVNDPAPAAPVETERRCQKCGGTTKGEEAYVDGQVWCHPCADARCSADKESAADTELYRLRDLIASHIACEADCQKMPTGCGCALTAARAVMNGGPQGAAVREALEIAEDVLSRAPFSTAIWPNGMHPNRGIEKIRAALALTRPVLCTCAALGKPNIPHVRSCPAHPSHNRGTENG